MGNQTTNQKWMMNLTLMPTTAPSDLPRFSICRPSGSFTRSRYWLKVSPKVMPQGGKGASFSGSEHLQVQRDLILVDHPLSSLSEQGGTARTAPKNNLLQSAVIGQGRHSIPWSIEKWIPSHFQQLCSESTTISQETRPHRLSTGWFLGNPQKHAKTLQNDGRL